MKDDYIHIRVSSELKQAAKQHAAETGRTLAGLIEWLLRQELKQADSLKRGGQIGGNTMKDLKKWLERNYGATKETEIEYDGRTYKGYMYGNDECFECNDFYQYFLTNGTLYKAFFEIPDGETDLGNLDYDNPIDLQDADAQYYIDYVI
jgi:hypothetical protein